MRLLLHICCAPCSVACIPVLREAGYSVTGFWYNPNIHPYKEYQARRQTFMQYAKEIQMPLIEGGKYGLRSFLSEIQGDFDGRCQYCYQMRMAQTAQYASENGFDAFTSTLFISPYQNYDLMKKIALQEAEKWNVGFYEFDFRPFFKEGQDEARQNEMYMQKYCGCIFSEEDRYSKKKKTSTG